MKTESDSVRGGDVMGRPDRIHFNCPQCGEAVRAPLDRAGRRAKCGACHQKIPVPGRPPDPAGPPPGDEPDAALSLDDSWPPLAPPPPPPSRRAPPPPPPSRRAPPPPPPSRPVTPPRRSAPAPEPDDEDDAEAPAPDRTVFLWVGLAVLIATTLFCVAILVFVVTRKKDPPPGGAETVSAPPAPARPTTPAEPATGGPGPAEGKGEPAAPPKADTPKAAPPKAAAPDPHANDRDLKLLQGKWVPRKVWVGPGSTEASAVIGGIITIDGKTFKQQTLGEGGKLGEVVGTITKIDAAKNPKELEITFEKDVGLGWGPHGGKVFRALYSADDDTFELFRVAPGVELPARFGLFGVRGPIGLDDGQRFDQCVRRR